VAARRENEPPIITVPRYLAAVRSLHGLQAAEMARALHVSPSVVRRWSRGTLIPTWRRVRSMTGLWGGDPQLLGLGAVLQRYCRASGLSLVEAVRMVRSGRRTGPERRTATPRPRDRRQLALPIER
jgi:transcriptional regulator with XRE-family HTH domain